MSRERRPDVTQEEKLAIVEAICKIHIEEPQLSVRAYMYRLWARGDIYLHGQLSTKGKNENTIQGLILDFRRDGIIPYESIIDGTRPTSYAEGGYDDIDEARDTMADARRNMVNAYELNIWTPQGKRVEMLSEKETLTIIVERVTTQYQVNLTSCKGFGSESMLYEAAKRAARSDVPTTFLIFTDHDRAGHNMGEHVAREIPRLVELVCDGGRLAVPPVEFVRIGLNAVQVSRYGVTTREPKSNEHPGMKNYIAAPAEIDALRSAQIEEIVREGIEAQLDLDLLARTRALEAEDIATLRAELDGEAQD